MGPLSSGGRSSTLQITRFAVCNRFRGDEQPLRVQRAIAPAASFVHSAGDQYRTGHTMRSLLATVCFSFICIASVSAQQPAPTPPAAAAPTPPAAAQTPPAAAQTPTATPAPQGNFIECRKMARQGKVPKEQRRAFVRDCTRDIAAECGAKARQQKLRSEERRAFVRECTGRPARRSKS
jgi:hypothetical protein